MAKKIALIKTAALLVVGVCAAALAVSAKANTVQFDVSGTLTQTLPFTNPPPTPFSGIMMIDVTVGTVTAADIAVQGFSKDFANLTSQAGVVGLPPLYQISLSDGVGDSLNLTFVAVAFDGPIDFDCTVVPFPMCMTGLQRRSRAVVFSQLPQSRLAGATERVVTGGEKAAIGGRLPFLRPSFWSVCEANEFARWRVCANDGNTRFPGGRGGLQ